MSKFQITPINLKIQLSFFSIVVISVFCKIMIELTIQLFATATLDPNIMIIVVKLPVLGEVVAHGIFTKCFGNV